MNEYPEQRRDNIIAAAGIIICIIIAVTLTIIEPAPYCIETGENRYICASDA